MSNKPQDAKEEMTQMKKGKPTKKVLSESICKARSPREEKLTIPEYVNQKI